MKSLGTKYDLPVWETKWHQKESKKFRWFIKANQNISSIECFGIYGIKSFKVVTNDGEKSEVGF